MSTHAICTSTTVVASNEVGAILKYPPSLHVTLVQTPYGQSRAVNKVGQFTVVFWRLHDDPVPSHRESVLSDLIGVWTKERLTASSTTLRSGHSYGTILSVCVFLLQIVDRLLSGYQSLLSLGLQSGYFPVESQPHIPQHQGSLSIQPYTVFDTH